MQPTPADARKMGRAERSSQSGCGGPHGAAQEVREAIDGRSHLLSRDASTNVRNTPTGTVPSLADERSLTSLRVRQALRQAVPAGNQRVRSPVARDTRRCRSDHAPRIGCAHDRQTGGQRLVGRRRRAFTNRGEHEHLGAGKFLAHAGTGNGTSHVGHCRQVPE